MNRILLTNPQKRCAKILLECIANGKYTIEYGEMAALTGVPAHSRWNGVGAQIGEVSKLCHQLGLPLISVMVVLKDTQLCADGFYDLCNELNVHPEFRNNMGKMMEACMNDVKECKQWHILADEIGLVIENI